jgi:uncharacterized protein
MGWERWHDLLLEEMKNYMKSAPEVSPAHDAGHAKRVWIRSKKIGEKVGADLEILVAAAMLHDLARHHGLEVHGKASARLAEPILKKVGFPKEKIQPTLEAIAAHDYATPTEERKSLEAKVLYDADKMDAFGVVGVMRHIRYYSEQEGELSGRIPKIFERLSARWEGLGLSESREIAKSDYDYIRDYFEKLGEEL